MPARFFRFAVVLALAACAGSEAAPPVVSLRLIAFNDFHGNLESAARLAGAIRKLRQGHRDSVVVAAGDLVGASPLASSLFLDEPTVKALSDAGLELSAVGNHEFDHGAGELLRLQHGGCGAPPRCEAGRFDGARFHWLAANVFDAATGNALFPAYEIREYDGVRVAFVGAALQATPQVVAASAVAGLRFDDEAASVNALVPELRARGARVIVLLVHQGGHLPSRYDDPACRSFNGAIVGIVDRLDPAIDLVVSGHTHEAYACRVGGRLVASASSAGRMVAAIDLAIDRATGGVVSAEAKLVAINPTRFAADSAIERYVRRIVSRAAPRARRVVGIVHGELDAATTPAGQSRLGQLVADAQLAAMRSAGAQAAFTNAGGLRAPLGGRGPLDIVTYGDLHAAQPFGNTLVAMTLTGADLVRLLEQQWHAKAVAARPGLLAVSRGFEYAWDGAGPPGHRVIAHSVKIDGREVVPDGRYRIVVNDFLADRVQAYPVLGHGTDRVGGPLDIEALERYVASRVVTAAGVEDRVLRVDGRSHGGRGCEAAFCR